MQGSQGETRESTAELLVQAIEQAKKLVHVELEAARQELREDAREALKGLGLLSASAGLGLAGAIALSVSLALQGVRLLPKRPMAETVGQVKQDLDTVREQLT